MSTADPSAQGGTTDRKAAKPVPRKLIAALTRRFPAAFVGDRSKPHLPLKIGTAADLIAAGMLTLREASCALSCYTRRRMYYVAMAEGLPRLDLDGKVAGEVTSQQAAWARSQLARMDARAAALSRAAAPAGRKVGDATPGATAEAPRRLSLADLRAAAARRAGDVTDRSAQSKTDHPRCQHGREAVESERPRRGLQTPAEGL